MDTYLWKNDQQQGPFEDEQIQQFLHSGSVSYEDLAWREGLSDWQPVETFFPRPSQAPLAPPQAPLPPEPPGIVDTPKATAETLGWALVVLPIIGTLLIWLEVAPPMTIEILTILGTGALVFIEATRLGMGRAGDVTPKGKKRSGPWGWGLTVLLLWIVGYPAYLYTRSKYGMRNRVWNGLGAMIVMLCAAWYFQAHQLPAVDNPQVVALAEQALKQSPGFRLSGANAATVSISAPGETRYLKSPQKRYARAMLQTNLGSEPIYYTVEWQDREKGIIWVSVLTGGANTNEATPPDQTTPLPPTGGVPESSPSAACALNFVRLVATKQYEQAKQLIIPKGTIASDSDDDVFGPDGGSPPVPYRPTAKTFKVAEDARKSFETSDAAKANGILDYKFYNVSFIYMPNPGEIEEDNQWQQADYLVGVVNHNGRWLVTTCMDNR